ncbi:glycogen debranching enzyme, putative [Filimonas lacunae]|uniref:Glycogen debranching enzyme, putative n=1 Tax=Filimonas lacunae TaxID=477680 RepID=A0A173ME78_9BACT|nr:amylo-alpha-1,6-glucosidase [Filimonas lacunae]BAV05902.1 glycogen debranching enzyme [Filimonas lacunae]SIT34542.1 glycogen debranching enzyme, putative [Filimonas lacunae]
MLQKTGIALLLSLTTFMGNSQETTLFQTCTQLDKMGMHVLREQNRSVSYTNQEAAYYYTQSHVTDHVEYAWFEGMNIAKNRIFGGYELYHNQQLLSHETADVWVYPHKLLRTYTDSIQEELWMLDGKNSLAIDIANATGTIGIRLKGKGVTQQALQNNIAFFSPMEGQYVIAVSAQKNTPVQYKNNLLSTTASAGGFYIAVGKTQAEATQLLQATRKHIIDWKQQRRTAMQTFLFYNGYTYTGIDSVDKALDWLQITTRQLVTHQQGYGIYAGLPWFNEYWGRDEFISLPGATLVNGQFAVARNILVSFAKYQQTDPHSRFFGRVPNIVNPQNIDYHTTDGTPRFIIQLLDYVKYSGDTALIRQLYPQIKNSIAGALKYWVDEKGYLLHEDNETWMDARDANLVSYSPRGTRANDIQALWYHQLCAGVYFARYMKDKSNSSRWQQAADKVKHDFATDFTDKEHSYLADRLTKENKPDFVMRPNQLFAMDMLNDTILKNNILSQVWQQLVYPWGVSTLAQNDSSFHPYHLSPLYHKDAAYHNGTVWPWLNGIAMQRMMEAHQTETAWKLFQHMNWQALHLGVVGGLSENLDAYPHPGQTWPKLTGAYLQAWSNAEQLRIWYQYFLGIHPDMPNNTLTLAPSLPNEITHLQYFIRVGKDMIEAMYNANDERKSYTYSLPNHAMKVVVDIFPYEKTTIAIPADRDASLYIEQQDEVLSISTITHSGSNKRTIKVPVSAARLAQQKTCDQQLAHIPFAIPSPDIKNQQFLQ